MGLDQETVDYILKLGREDVDVRTIYKKVRSDFKDRKIRAKNLITLNQIKYHLKKLNKDLSTDDFKNIDLKFKQVQDKDPSQRFMQFYKPRNKTDENFPLLNHEQFFLVLMNKFQMNMVKELNLQEERIVCMDETFGLNNKKVI